MALKYGYTGIAALLRAAGADVTLGDAVMLNEEETVRALLQKGADANEWTPYGDSLLSVAMTRGYPAIARLLTA